MNSNQEILIRIAEALERISPNLDKKIDLNKSDGFVYEAHLKNIKPIIKISRIPINLLKGLENQKEILLKNTENFANGLPANNALLWGAKGTGKSSLVKSVHAEIIANSSNKIKLIEIHREDIINLPYLLSKLAEYVNYKFILLCDDLSFDAGENTYKSLKSVLDGGIEGKPNNIVFYATSNRRHLMPRDMIENERSSSINPSEATEEKVSLSDRFGLWIGFHNISQDVYLEIIDGYVNELGLKINKDSLKSKALEWSITRGARSGRVAWQFILQLAGELNKQINLN
ncbi:MAG: AAA family ATPase [SAR116 cluster bacterium]|nr:AAA family ATPase [SAR116 cluster bacterium]RPH10010.1 MAG: ATP-binding protein [Alphaproteobacteria bacterium TMED54]